MKKISQIARSEWESYKNSPIEISEGYLFSQYKTIRRINHYINDKYLESDNDMIFWNLSTPRVPHFAKNLDLDTKDLMPMGKGETNFYQAWILRLKFKKWLIDTGFALTLNDLAESLAIYGSTVFKKVLSDKGKEHKYELEEVKLENIAFDSSVKNIKDSNFIVERHFLSEQDIRQRIGVWDNIEKAIDKAEIVETNDSTQDYTEVPTYLFYQRVGEVQNDEGDYVLKNVIFTGYGEDEVIVFEEELKENDIYFDFHVGKYKGRWLRQGIVEKLFKLQERVNALVNQNAQTTEISSLLLLKTADPNTRGNVLTSASSGDIIQSADIQQLAIDNRALTGFVQELQLIERQADRLALTPEIITGETMPSGTPFRGAAISNNAAKSTFKFYKQSIGEKLGQLLLTQIMPSLIEKWNAGDIIDIADNEEDIRLFDNIVLNKHLWKSMREYFSKTGRLPSATQLQALAMRLIEEQGKETRKLEVPKGFFNFKFGFYMNVTDEAEDKNAMNESLTNAINMTLANPQVINNPLFRQMLENNGISPVKFDNPLQQPQQQEQGKPVQPVAGGDKLFNEVVK